MYGEWKELERGFKNILHNPNAMNDERHEIEREVKETKDEAIHKVTVAAIEGVKNQLANTLEAAVRRQDEVYNQTRDHKQANEAAKELFRSRFIDMKRVILAVKDTPDARKGMDLIFNMVNNANSVKAARTAILSIIKTFKF